MQNIRKGIFNMIPTKNMIKILQKISEYNYKDSRLTQTRLSKEINLGIIATQKNVNMLSDYKFIYKEKHGRDCYLYMTGKGYMLIYCMDEINTMFKKEE